MNFCYAKIPGYSVTAEQVGLSGSKLPRSLEPPGPPCTVLKIEDFELRSFTK